MAFYPHNQLKLAREVGLTNIRGDRPLAPTNDPNWDGDTYDSIVLKGVLEPITLIWQGDDLLVAEGEMRYVATQYAREQGIRIPGEYAEDGTYLIPCTVRDDIKDVTELEFHKFQYHVNSQTEIPVSQKIVFFKSVLEKGLTPTEISDEFSISMPRLSQYLTVAHSPLFSLVADGTLGSTVALEIVRKARALELDPNDVYNELTDLHDGSKNIRVRDVKDYGKNIDERDHLPELGLSGGLGSGLSELTTTNTVIGGEGFTPGAGGNYEEDDDDETPNPGEAKELDPALKKIDQVGKVVDANVKKTFKNLQKMYESMEETEGSDDRFTNNLKFSEFMVFLTVVRDAMDHNFTEEEFYNRIEEIL